MINNKPLNNFLKKSKLFLIKRKEIVSLTFVLLFAFFLRIYSLGLPNLWIDETISSMASLNILEKGFPVLDSGIIYSRALLFHYTQAGFILLGKIFSGNMDFFTRLPSVFFGLLTIVLGYFIGKEYSIDKKKAWISVLVVALFLGVFSFEVFYSRQARFYQLFQLLFFASLFFLYKSKSNPKFLYISLITFFLAIDTQIQGLVLAPFLILHILMFSKGKLKYLAIIPAIPLIWKFFPVLGLSQTLSASGTESSRSFIGQYFNNYLSFGRNILYLGVLSVPGMIWSYIRNKRLTLLFVVPSLLTFIGILTLKTFAFRYAYFLIFLLVFYSAIVFSFLYERYGKLMLIPLVLLLLIPSNLFFPLTYGTVLKPINNQMSDSSAPVIEYKNIPDFLVTELKNTKLVTYFSPAVEYYIKKSDYVLPFSMDGRGSDSISINNSKNQVVDKYSGASMIQNISKLEEEFYFIASSYAVSKLKEEQIGNIEYAEDKCEVEISGNTFKVYYCGED